jgi:hypothetical protein
MQREEHPGQYLACAYGVYLMDWRRRHAMSHAVPDQLRTIGAALEYDRGFRMRVSTIEARVFDLIHKEQIRQVTRRAAVSILSRNEMLEHVDRNLCAGSLITEKPQPGQLLPRRHRPQMHVLSVQVGFREQIETRFTSAAKPTCPSKRAAAAAATA